VNLLRSAINMRTVFPLRSVLRGVAVAALVGGCAGSMGTMRPGPSVPADSPGAGSAAAPAGTTFDGSYRVTLRTANSAADANLASWCASPGQPVVTVTNGRFTFAVPHPNIPGNATPVFPATIAADGSFSGQITAGNISGLVTGTHMQGRIEGTGCLYEFSGDRV
jgi:hypothetical protein